MKNSIAIIVTWFGGSLPPYFPAWLRSAEMNSDIDFYIFYDKEENNLKSNKPNIFVIASSFKKEVQRAVDELGEPVTFDNIYKCPDLRPFYGIVYQEYVSEYDFWGYCDVDLAFGHIRSFLSDERLSQYDRFYEWGHFSVYRNNEKINHLFELPGSIYSRDEIFRTNLHVFAEEHNGINRIFRKNHIPWNQGRGDIADFYIAYSDWILWDVQLKNYLHQVFYWENGRVFRAAVDEQGKVVVNEFVYIHWQKRKPIVDPKILESEGFYVFPDKLIPKCAGTPQVTEIVQMTPLVSKSTHQKERRAYLREKVVDFLRAPFGLKKIWIRQKWTMLRDTGSMFAQRKRNADYFDKERGI